MATRYGYRIFAVKVHREHKRPTLDFSDLTLGKGDKAESFDATIKAVCDANLGKTHTEILRYREPRTSVDVAGGVEDTTPYLRLLSYDLTPGTRYDFEFKFGRRGSHDLAMGENAADDAPLDHLAPSNSFRAFLYLPAAGSTAILVAETRSRLCPGLDLLRLLGVGTKTMDESRLEPDRIGWWRLSGQRLTDNVQMKKFVEQGEASYIELRKSIVSGSGKRKSETVRVRQDGMPILKKKEQAKALVGSWFGLDNSALGIDQSKPSGATLQTQLASLLEVKVDPTQFEDGGVGWEGPDGTTIFLKPDDLDDAFTYRVGRPGYRPEDDDIRLAAEDTLRGLQATLQIDLDI